MTAELAVPAEDAWSLLVDTRRWPDWGPSVASVELDPAPGVDPATSQLIQAGSTGSVLTAVRLRLPFRVTAFTPGRSWSWQVAGVAATDHRVEPLGPERCRVGFGVPVAAVAYLGVCRVALQRIGAILDERSVQ